MEMSRISMTAAQVHSADETHQRGAADPRIRVLLIAPSLHILGGQAVQAQRLLGEIGQDASVSMEFMAIAPVFAGPFRFLQSIRYLRTILTFLYYLPQVLWNVPRFEIIHVFSASYWSYTLWSLPPLLLGRLLGKKVILNYRSGEADDHLANWKSAIPTIKLADEIVSPSGYLVDVFANFGLKVRSIFNIIDPGKFRHRERRKLRPVFLHNRILEPLYNVGCALRAFKIVQEKYPEASLTVAHDGISRPGLEALAGELGLRNTKFIGRVPHSKIADLYDSADIYLTCPDLDCMPGSLLECYASGLPIISTNAGGIPYIVRHGETGLLIDRNDHEAMAAWALRLLEDEELVARITAQGRRELEKYSGGAVRRQWVSLYRTLVGR
jgi:glycosyltransferase involved in cell wall biosynthesis